MNEVHLQCQFGRLKRKPGKKGKPSQCPNRASGLWEVTFKRGPTRYMLLCADCGFHGVGNTVAMVMVGEKDKQEPVFFHPVQSVKLIQSLNTPFVQAKAKPGPESKHWVEAQPKPEAQPLVTSIIRYAPRGTQMDLPAYINSLRQHDDGL